MAHVAGIRSDTLILCEIAPASPPSPLSKRGEGEPNAPSPSLGKGLGDGERTERLTVLPISVIHSGNLVLTLFNRMMPVVGVVSEHYTGEMLELHFHETSHPLHITPSHQVAAIAAQLPKVLARTLRARELRRNQTVSELLMWDLLRNEKMGTRFRRQHPMGPFILDFYAPEVRLAIEVDGAIHTVTEQKAYDQFRQQMIEQHEVAFIRIINSDVVSCQTQVIATITKQVSERRNQFCHKIKWMQAIDLAPGMSVFARGQQEYRMVKGINHIDVDERIYCLKVVDDCSYATDLCTLRQM